MITKCGCLVTKYWWYYIVCAKHDSAIPFQVRSENNLLTIREELSTFKIKIETEFAALRAKVCEQSQIINKSEHKLCKLSNKISVPPPPDYTLRCKFQLNHHPYGNKLTTIHLQQIDIHEMSLAFHGNRFSTDDYSTINTLWVPVKTGDTPKEIR